MGLFFNSTNDIDDGKQDQPEVTSHSRELPNGNPDNWSGYPDATLTRELRLGAMGAAVWELWELHCCSTPNVSLLPPTRQLVQNGKAINFWTL